MLDPLVVLRNSSWTRRSPESSGWKLDDPDRAAAGEHRSAVVLGEHLDAGADALDDAAPG